MRKALTTLLILLAACTITHAQARLVFGTTTLSADTVHANETVYVSTSLINTGNQPYNGRLWFAFSINGVRNISRSIFNPPYNGEVVSINPGQQLPLQFEVVAQPQYFVPGPDIFVVWPITENNTTPDTLQAQIVVLDGINDVAAEQDESNLRIYSTNNTLIITQADAAPQLKNIALYSITGSLMYYTTNTGNITLPLDNYTPGIYLVQIQLGNGRYKTYKVAVSPK